jgi:intracellular septation protein
MQPLLDLAPLLVFLVAYYLEGFYVATGALMVAMVVLVAVDWLWHRRVSTMHAVSTALVLVFGTATLLLHDQRFIQWKPTVFFWLIAAALIVNRWVGRQLIVERLLAPVLGADRSLPRELWLRVNTWWAAFYASIGVANLAVAWNMSERFWVNFKVFGLTALTLAFMFAQIPWLLRQARAPA